LSKEVNEVSLDDRVFSWVDWDMVCAGCISEGKVKRRKSLNCPDFEKKEVR